MIPKGRQRHDTGLSFGFLRRRNAQPPKSWRPVAIKHGMFTDVMLTKYSLQGRKRRFVVNGLRWVCHWILLAIPATAFSWSASLDCDWQMPTLQCSVRPLAPIQIQRAALTVDAQAKQYTAHWQPFANSGRESAILWLVDVSDPARAGTVKQQQQLLQSWLPPLTGAHYQLGLAAFADSLRTLAPLSSELSVLSEAIKGLSAQGYSTAFYQSLLNSLELLKWTKAEHKSLWIFSDGMAEDTAYRHEDVVQAALKSNVMIVGLGYPERKSQRPQLQRLQRLAEETGGYFVAASEGQLPANTLSGILSLVNGGGVLSLDLPEFYGSHQVTLALWDRAGDVFTKTLTLEGPPPPPEKATRLSTEVAETAVVEGATTAFAETAARVSFISWYGWLAASVVVVMVPVVWLLVRKKPVSQAMLARFEDLHSGRGLAVQVACCRLGRAPDNDLCFNNDSVSAHHAELYQHRDGTFVIADLSSTNGVWVNGERITTENLRSGDVVELGEVRLRFCEVPQGE